MKKWYICGLLIVWLRKIIKITACSLYLRFEDIGHPKQIYWERTPWLTPLQVKSLLHLFKLILAVPISIRVKLHTSITSLI